MPSTITTDQLSADLNHALGDFPVTITMSVPTVGVFSSTRMDLEYGFEVELNGRTEKVDTKFFINCSEYATLPSKGAILTDGERNYKVFSAQKDASQVELALDCISQFQSGR